MSALYFLILLCIVVVAWHRPRVALALVLALLPSYLLRFTVAGIPMTVLELLILSCSVVVLLHWRFDADATQPARSSSLGDPLIALSMVWIAVGFLAALGSDAGMRGWGIWKAYVVEPVLFFWAIHTLREQLDARRHIVLPLAVAALGVAAIAVWQYWSGYGIPYPWFEPAARRVTSVFGYPNAVGLFLAPIAVLALGFALSGVRTIFNGRTRSCVAGGNVASFLCGYLVSCSLFLVTATSVVAVWLTRGAAAIIATVIGVAALLKWSLFRGWLARRAGGAAFMLIIGWVIACLAITAWLPFQPERPRSGPEWWQKVSFQQWSGSVRLSQYRETWELLRDHPLRGAGLADYQRAVQPYHEKADVEIFMYPHNLLLAMWVEFGLFGLALFLVIVMRGFRAAFTHGRIAAAAALLTVLIFGLVDVPFFKNDLAVLTWAFLALAAVPMGRLD
ncbi:MAG: O-antigen ligase family protein [Candidatus Uhrbacteria bacterium]